MKIILKYLLTNLKERKTRTAVMMLSILLSTTLLFVSFSIGASYESAQRKMGRGMAGSATLSVKSKMGGIDDRVLPKLSSLKASVGILEGKALYHENGYYESMDLIAADISQLNKINPPRMADGSELKILSGSQVILPDRFTEKYNLEEGDTITLQISGKAVKLKVAGIASYDTVFLRHTRGATALLPLSTLAELTGQTEAYSKVLVEPADGVSTDELKNELCKSLTPDNYEVTEVVDEAQIEADARQKTLPFFLISFFALTMSIFIIYSSYQVITLDRLPIIGTFRSIGATQKSVTQILLLESVLYGGMGGLAGILVGVLVLKLILQGMGQSLSQGIEIPVVIPLSCIVVSFAVAVMVSLFSAWFPVRKASRLPIKDVVLGTVEERQVPKRRIVGIGVVLFVVSILLPKVSDGKQLYLAGGLSLLGLIVAAILTVPLVTDLLAMALEHLYGPVLGNEGRLAARNMRENKSVQQNITLLFISISAVIAITVVGNFVTTYVSDVFNGAELEGFADGYMEPDFVAQVEQIEGIQNVLPLHVYENQIQAGDTKLSRLEATDNLDLYSSMLGLHYSESGMLKEALSVFSKERSILLSESCVERTGFCVGDTLSLSNGAVQKDYLVIGSFKSRATDVEAVISSSFAKSDFDASAYHFLAYTAADPEAVMVQIRDLFGETQNWSRTVDEFYADAHSTVSTFLQPMHSLTYFILLLATVGVINNLLINYIQKRKSIAMYKSVGLSSRQSIKMTLIEGFSSGLIGAGFAMGISYLEIQTIFLVAGPKIQMVPEFESGTFLTAGIMGIIVTLVGSVVPIVKSKRMNLVEEIKWY